MSTPLCPYFRTCSGCTAQHLDYNTQLEKKKQGLIQATGFPKIQVFPSAPYFYRNRLELFWKNARLCLRGKNRSLIPISACVITEKKINNLLHEVSHFFTADLFQGVVIRVTSKGETSLSFVLRDDAPLAGEEIKKFSQITFADHVLITFASPSEFYSSEYLILKGKEYLEEELLGRTFYFPIQGFFQNNTFLTQQMHQYVRHLLQKNTTSGAELLDLYAGVGTFGIINAEYFRKVTLVEQVPSAVEMARRNIIVNRITNTQAFCLKGEQIGRLQVKNPLYVITDPPRSGMEMKTIAELNRLQPQVILYVSCNPQQLQKDLPKFKHHALRSVALFDFFPQTHHCETVVELALKTKKIS